jgi:flagellin
MRELGVQSASGSNSSADRGALDKEYQAMALELTRISDSTNLNGIHLLDASAGTAGLVKIQVGSGTTGENQIELKLPTTAVDAATLAVDGSLDTDANALLAVDAIDTALQTINDMRADLGAAQNRLTSTISNLQNINENASAALGRVQDTDFAAETAQMTKQQTLQQASTAVLAQANQLPSAVLKLLQ